MINKYDIIINYPWSTGVGALEAAEAIVQAAIENGNIKQLHGEWRWVQG